MRSSRHLGGNRASALLALGFGVFLAVAETVRNWGAWQWWPFWLVDYLAAALLVVSALAVLRQHVYGNALLCGAWGFTSAMFYMSFWSHIERTAPAEGNLAQGPLTVAIGALWLISLLGFGLAMHGARGNPERDVG